MSEDENAEEIARLTDERDEQETRADRLESNLDEARDEIADLRRELESLDTHDLDDTVEALVKEHGVKLVLETVIEYVR